MRSAGIVCTVASANIRRSERPAKLPSKTPDAKAPTVKAHATTVSLRLRAKQLQALDALAVDAGLTRSALIQLAVDRLLKQGL